MDVKCIRSKEAVRVYLMRGGNHNCVAEMLGRKSGFLTEIISEDRTYYMKIKFDEALEMMITELMPAINCSKPYREMFAEYVSVINTKHKCGYIGLEQNGNVYIHMEQSYQDGEISMDTIEKMEQISLKIAFEAEENLDRIAHGRFPIEETEKVEDHVMFDRLRNHMRDLPDWDDDVGKEKGEIQPVSLEDIFKNKGSKTFSELVEEKIKENEEKSSEKEELIEEEELIEFDDDSEANG